MHTYSHVWRLVERLSFDIYRIKIYWVMLTMHIFSKILSLGMECNSNAIQKSDSYWYCFFFFSESISFRREFRVQLKIIALNVKLFKFSGNRWKIGQIYDFKHSMRSFWKSFHKTLRAFHTFHSQNTIN